MEHYHARRTDAIAKFAQQTKKFPSRDWTIDESRHPVLVNSDTVEFWATFCTDAGDGRAHVRLEHSKDASWRAHTLLTVLSNLHDRPFAVAPHCRPNVSQHGPTVFRKYWHNQQQRDETQRPYVAIIGAGQGGLSLAARLQHLKVPYIVFESGSSPGASWRNRYPSLSLHDPVYYNHLPYLPFPKTWPLFSPRDRIAEWMEIYTRARLECPLRLQGSQGETNREWCSLGTRRGKINSNQENDHCSSQAHCLCYRELVETSCPTFSRNI